MMRPTFVLCLAAPLAAQKLHYGLVFDAGSSGTRIHIYTWSTGGGGPKDAFNLIGDDIKKIQPGLSAYKNEPEKAGASLRPLLEYAKSKIPADRLDTTPTFLMATAGLRLVGQEAKDAILRSVCTELSHAGVLFRCEWANLLDGHDEGLYGWVTVNYLLDTLYPGAAADTAGIIDLGGGSVQVVFSQPESSKAPAGYTEKLVFGGRTHDVYVKSHLGFGLDAARSALLDLLIAKRGDVNEKPIRHPCLPKGATLVYKQMTFLGAGHWQHCYTLTLKLFDTATCPHSSCSFNGSYQPKLPADFKAFSYMYDRTAAIGLLDGVPKQLGSQVMSQEDIVHAGEVLCGLNHEQVASRFSTHHDASKSSNFCGDVAYVAALLRSLGFSPASKLTMTNQIKDVELVWTLGAMLAKSAEIASASSNGSTTIRFVGGMLFLAACICFCFQRPSTSTYRSLGKK
mmetsp:Transcript_26684/g.64355  ORF Transcript_26684/g.64355 Transcript_26684/m.64355 type:complete len:455 (-) Transcript_26684:374-1738(-)